jgi:hypothetical protein
MRVVLAGADRLPELEAMLRRQCEQLPPALGPLPEYASLPYPFDCARSLHLNYRVSL